MSELTRRRAVGATVGAVAAAAVGAGVARAATAPRPTAPVGRAAHNGHGGHTGHGSLPAFDEVFQGRRIQGAPATGGHHAEHGAGYAVRIDGRELHIMRNADGTWISVVNHYETYADPRALARAAVVELQGAQLVPMV
ncbi:tyrosinase cofactor [Streptomyces sp. NRRL S-87]|uniref:apotyrosinase chaperone MelC1 n=1 Tax=Streptomyces sp. NRRL S-87 TaxID=1463920 RepID=UPI0004BFC64C|nr:tyrosinase cofactor [Streptomyces sp. NRRL S-87]